MSHFPFPGPGDIGRPYYRLPPILPRRYDPNRPFTISHPPRNNPTHSIFLIALYLFIILLIYQNISRI